MKMLSNRPPSKDPRELWNHFSKTYMSLRTGLFMLAFSMPFVLYLYGKYRHGLDLQPSMSAYFWAAAQQQCATFPMRTIFVGYLFAIGVSLFAYKGLTNLENTLLNVAALCAVTVAIYPERLALADAATYPQVALLFESCPAVKEWARWPSPPIHYIAAITLFVLLAIVSWACTDNTLKYLPKGYDPATFRIAYRLIAIAMILFPALGYLVALLVREQTNKVFFIEAAGVLTFGVYWLVKTYELKLSSLEKDPAGAVLQVASQPPRVEVPIEDDASED
jgi:hypothetical protein